MSPYKDLIDKMVWSYSRLSSFAQCKYQFYLKYIENDESEHLSEGNYYAELGSYVHLILEKIFKGELSVDDAAQYYVDHFDDNVFYTTDQSIMDKNFESCANYFAELDLSWMKDFDVIGVERKIETEIGGYPFIGFIDLLVRHKETGDIILIDHKSAKYPLSKKTGKLLKSSEDSFRSYEKQMYLYCKYVYEQYGKFPKVIAWNFFKDGEMVYIPFNEADYQGALNWFEETIHQIENEEEFAETSDFFYCHRLCDYRYSCDYNKYADSKDDGR